MVLMSVFSLIDKFCDAVVLFYHNWPILSIIIALPIAYLIIRLLIRSILSLFISVRRLCESPKYRYTIARNFEKSVGSFSFLTVGVALLICLVLFMVLVSIDKITSDSDTNSLMVACITLCVTLATIIPYILGKSTIKNEVDEVMDRKFNEISNLQEYNRLAHKDMAHGQRMHASMLLEMARPINQNNEAISDESKQNVFKNAAWAVGWAAKACYSYILIKDTYRRADKYIEQCCNLVSESYELLSRIKVKGNNLNVNHFSDAIVSLVGLIAVKQVSRVSLSRENDSEIEMITQKMYNQYTSIQKENSILSIGRCMPTSIMNDVLEDNIEVALHDIIEKLKNNRLYSEIVNQK